MHFEGTPVCVLTLIWILTTLAMFPLTGLLAPLPSAGLPSFICIVLSLRAPSSIWEDESSHLQPLFLGLSPGSYCTCPNGHTANMCSLTPHPVVHTLWKYFIQMHMIFFIKPGQLLSVHHYRQILGAKEKKKDNEKQWQEQLANQYNIPSLFVQSAPAVGPLSWGFIECTHVINPNKPTFVKNILKTSAQKSTFWSRSCTILIKKKTTTHTEASSTVSQLNSSVHRCLQENAQHKISPRISVSWEKGWMMTIVMLIRATINKYFSAPVTVHRSVHLNPVILIIPIYTCQNWGQEGEISFPRSHS